MVGTPLLPNQLGASARVIVEAAWGADLTANPGTWSWTDISTDVRQPSGVVISPLAKANEADQSQPATCTFQLKNQTGAYTPYSPTATNYPNLRKGTPIRVRVTLDGSNFFVRFQGNANGFPPAWDAQGRAAYVKVSASGQLRRLGQSGAKLHSAVYRAITTASTLPDAYWPCEDGANVQTVISPITGVTPMLIVGAGDFSAEAGAAGSDVQPNFSAGGSLDGTVPGSSAVTSWRIQCLAKANTVTPPAFEVPLEWDTADGNGWELLFNDLTSGGLGYSDTLGNTFTSGIKVDDGDWHELRVTATQSGGNIALVVSLDGATVISQSFAGTVSRITKVYSNRSGSVAGIISGVGHFAVWNNTTSVSGLDSVLAMNGNAGETATARMTRLTTEESIPFSLTGSAGILMGPQGVDTVANLLRECETVDGGILYDGLSAGLAYIAAGSLYNVSAALTVDANSGQVPVSPMIVPADDDQQLRNKWTANRPNGSFATRSDATGPLGTNVVGTYDSQVTTNVLADSMLGDQASWRVHLGTVEGFRYPNLYLDLAGAPELAAAWLATTPGERIDVTNLSNRLSQHPTGTISLLLQGYSETLNSRQWTVAANCGPYRPWEVFSIQDARLGRIETDGSTLNSSATSGTTSLSVASSGKVWDTTAPSFDIDVEGEQITVTAITGSSSPQTFTVTRSVNGVVKAHNSGVTVKLWKPGVLAL